MKKLSDLAVLAALILSLTLPASARAEEGFAGAPEEQSANARQPFDGSAAGNSAPAAGVSAGAPGAKDAAVGIKKAEGKIVKKTAVPAPASSEGEPLSTGTKAMVAFGTLAGTMAGAVLLLLNPLLFGGMVLGGIGAGVLTAINKNDPLESKKLNLLELGWHAIFGAMGGVSAFTSAGALAGRMVGRGLEKLFAKK